MIPDSFMPPVDYNLTLRIMGNTKRTLIWIKGKNFHGFREGNCEVPVEARDAEQGALFPQNERQKGHINTNE